MRMRMGMTLGRPQGPGKEGQSNAEGKGPEGPGSRPDIPHPLMTLHDLLRMLTTLTTLGARRTAPTHRAHGAQ